MKNYGQSRLMLGDIYHWEMDRLGKYVIKKNLMEV